jgi:hypothetical protein
VQRYGHSPLKPGPLYRLFGEGCLDLVCFMNVRNWTLFYVSASLAFESAVDKIQCDAIPKADLVLQGRSFDVNGKK